MRPLILLGWGYVAQRLASAVGPRRTVWATTRQPAETVASWEPVAGVDFLPISADGAGLEALPSGADVVVSFPPDGASDAAWAARVPRPARLVYVSSTAVFGSRVGAIDAETAAAPDSDRGKRRLQAEEVWRALDACVLRTPAIYGPGRGAHERIRAGTHRLVDGGGGRVSRIHVDDLVRCILAGLERPPAGEVFVIGDASPCTQLEIAEHVCAALRVPLPPEVGRDRAAPTLTGDRSVDSSTALRALGVVLAYPSYREGLRDLLAGPS